MVWLCVGGVQKARAEEEAGEGETFYRRKRRGNNWSGVGVRVGVGDPESGGERHKSRTIAAFLQSSTGYMVSGAWFVAVGSKFRYDVILTEDVRILK